MEPGGPLIPRRRLIAPLLPASSDADTGPAVTRAPITIVAAIADAGFGKSIVIRDILGAAPGTGVLVELDQRTTTTALLDRVAEAARSQGLSDLVRALAGSRRLIDPHDTAAAFGRLLDEGIWLGVDEAQLLDDAASAFLAESVSRVRGPGRILLAGRALPGPLIRPLRSGALLTSSDLAFTHEDIVTLLSEQDRPDAAMSATRLLTSTGGWPAAVGVAVLRTDLDDDLLATHDPGATAALPDPAGVPAPIRGLLCLPVFNAEIGELILGASALAQLRRAGIPAVHRQDGWWEIADPIRHHLAAPAELASHQRREVARICAEHGRLRLAFDTVADDPEGAALLLAEQPINALEALGTSGLEAVLAAIDDAALAQCPAGLAHAIRYSENLPVSGERQHWLARAERLLGPDHSLRPFVLAESARMALRASDLERAESLARQALAHPDATDAHRGRAELVLGLASATRYTRDSMRNAAEHLSTAIVLLGSSGDVSGEAEARLTLAYGVDFSLGAIPAAVQGLRDALDVLPIGDVRRVDVLVYLAEALCWLPDLAGAEIVLRTAETAAARIQDERLLAYVQWGWAWVDALRRDVPALHARVQTLLTMTTGLWYRLTAGAALHCDLAEMFAAVGDIDTALAHLRITEERIAADRLTGVPVDSAWVAVHARHGDPAVALERILRLIAASDATPAHQWRYHLLAAWCAHRAVDAVAASDHAVAAFASATNSGHAAMVDAIEPEIAAWARQITGRAEARASYEVTVFGAFGVRHGSAIVTPSPGAPRLLVAALVVNGPQSVERLADLLWPEAGTAVGRARMRNLLNRIRSTAGDLVIRVGDRIALSDATVTDLSRFEDLASEVAAAGDSDARGPALTALQIARGELLPGMEGDWIDLARTRLARLRLDLHDRISRAATRAGDLDMAIRSLGEAAAADPLDARWSLRRAALLLRQGRHVAARNTIAHAIDASAEYGLAPGADLLAAARKYGVATTTIAPGPADTRHPHAR